MRFKVLVIVLSLFSVLGGYAQNMLSGVIVDEKSLSPLPGVTILNPNSGKGTTSKANGEFSIEFDEFPLVLLFRHIGYFEDSLQILNSEGYQKYYEGNTFSLKMRINPFQLDEVVVTTPGIATKLFEDEPYAIMDYVVKNDRFIALGYRNYYPLRREIFIGQFSGRIINSIPLPSFQEIYQDCLGEVYAITKDSVTHLRIQNDSVIFHQAYDPLFFEDYVKPIKAFSDSCYIYLNESKNGLFQDYFIYDTENQDSRIFYRVGDYGKEMGYTNIDKQIKSQVVSKIKRGFIDRNQMRIINDRISHQMFRRSNDYKPVESTMFQLEDSVLLFDFDYQAVHCFTSDAKLKWRTDIQVDLNKDFNGRTHHDKISNRFFLEFINVQQSYLIEIDPLTGEGLNTIAIQNFKHIDHISVSDNKIFFLHQPDFGNRGKKLYYLDIKK